MYTPYYSRFQVKIVNKPFYSDTGVQYPNTAVISFFDDKQREVNCVDYGYLSTNEIYDRINDCSCVELDFCYVRNFSLTAYRRMQIKDKKEMLPLKCISAHRAFFDSQFAVDFSFVEITEGDINFSNTHFAHGAVDFNHLICQKGYVDFSDVVIRSPQVDFSNMHLGSGDVSFKNAIFYKGEKNFQYTDFGSGMLNFTNAEFNDGSVMFINSVFNNNKVIFKVARFGVGEIDFHYSKFRGGDISFERVMFGDGTFNFKTVEFGDGKVNFNRAEFGNGNIFFEGCSSQGRMTFKKAQFGNGDINFELAEFDSSELNFEKAVLGKGAISFFNSRFKSLSLSGCQINDYLDLRVQHCESVNLSDTIVRDIVDFKPYEFDVDISVLTISGMRLLGVIYIDWERNKVLELVRKQKKTRLNEKAEQFRIFKESFNKAGQYSDEDNAYVWFKRYEAMADLQSKTHHKPLTRIYEYPVYAFRKLVFDYIGLFATNPVRVMFSMLVTLSFFGLIYATVLKLGWGNIVSGIGGDHDKLGIIGRSFYHSGITFFTIGYGDFYPLGAMRWLSNIEGFMGVFLMSYFTVAFVRKILR